MCAAGKQADWRTIFVKKEGQEGCKQGCQQAKEEASMQRGKKKQATNEERKTDAGKDAYKEACTWPHMTTQGPRCTRLRVHPGYTMGASKTEQTGKLAN